jgi:protein-S-isoprenylcysteine O-methyltransferase Ste14
MKSLENRVPPPLVALAFATVMWAVSSLDNSLMLNPTRNAYAATLFFMLGFSFSLAGVLSFRKFKTTVNPLKPQAATALVTTGVYRFTRNPMYVGFVFLLLAWTIWLGSAFSLALVLVFIMYINRFQIAPEERALLLLFGSEFEQYKSRVRRWL